MHTITITIALKKLGFQKGAKRTRKAAASPGYIVWQDDDRVVVSAQGAGSHEEHERLIAIYRVALADTFRIGGEDGCGNFWISERKAHT